MSATIRIHLPAHRERALSLQSEQQAAQAAYDQHITAYLDYLKAEAASAGYTVEVDHRDNEAAIAYEGDHAAAKAAHDWLETLPDLWNWIP